MIRALVFIIGLLAFACLAGCTPPIRSTLPPTAVEKAPTAKPIKQSDLGNPPEPRRGRVVVTETAIELLPDVTFVGNTAELSDDARRTLTAFAQTLELHDDISLIEVRGHSDSSGDRVSRAELSSQRAQVVIAFLVAHGVSEGRLVPYGASDSEPLSLTNDALNRRIELIVLERD